MHYENRDQNLNLVPRNSSMVWYGMVNVDLYSAIITKVSNALDTLVSGEKPVPHLAVSATLTLSPDLNPNSNANSLLNKSLLYADDVALPACSKPSTSRVRRAHSNKPAAAGIHRTVS